MSTNNERVLNLLPDCEPRDHRTVPDAAGEGMVRAWLDQHALPSTVLPKQPGALHTIGRRAAVFVRDHHRVVFGPAALLTIAAMIHGAPEFIPSDFFTSSPLADADPEARRLIRTLEIHVKMISSAIADVIFGIHSIALGIKTTGYMAGGDAEDGVEIGLNTVLYLLLYLGIPYALLVL